MEPVLTRIYKVRALEADSAGLARPVTLFNYLQESAMDHAAELGVAVQDLRRRDLTWVLSRFLLRIRHYPAAGETVQVQTWPSAREGMYTYRDFEVMGNGKVIASASSAWALLDLRTRRPVRLAHALPDYPLHRHRVLQFPSERVRAPECADLELPFRVRRSDLDINCHVNSGIYLEWSLESAPVELAERCRPAEIEIGYRAEAFYGDTVLARTEVTQAGEETACLHMLICRKDAREFARARTLWREFSAITTRKKPAIPEE